MPNQNEYQLVDYLDDNLSEQDRREVEELIHTNHQAYEQWNYLKLSVEAIEYAALYKQVGMVKEQYHAQPQPSAKGGTVKKIRFMFSAAAVLVVALGLGVYKYASTSAIALYEKNYAPYNLTIDRNTGVFTIDTLYQHKNWPAVIASFTNTREKDNKGLFLAAMAHMELKQYAEAAQHFEQLQLNNAQTGSDYFQEEADYYQAMSYLALGRSKEAIELLRKIRSDDSHIFYPRANRIGGIDLKILESKSGE